MLDQWHLKVYVSVPGTEPDLQLSVQLLGLLHWLKQVSQNVSLCQR